MKNSSRLKSPSPTAAIGLKINAELKLAVQLKAKQHRITLRQIVEDAFEKFLELEIKSEPISEVEILARKLAEIGEK